jgi:uridine kinase
MDRDRVLAEVWALVPTSARPVVVAVDGPVGAGKTTFADALAAVADRLVVRATLDDFHFPRVYRHAAGRTGETVWTRAFDYRAVRRELLEPWRREPGTPYRRRWHDPVSDTPVRDDPEPVPEGGVLLVDGVFAQRPELADLWDLVIYLDAPTEVRVPRMAARDGVSDDPEHPDQRRVLDAQQIYHDLVAPRARAAIVVDNGDVDAPHLVRSCLPS